MDYISINESHSSIEDDVYSVLSGIQLGLDMYIISRSHISWQERLGGEDGEFVSQMPRFRVQDVLTLLTEILTPRWFVY